MRRYGRKISFNNKSKYDGFRGPYALANNLLRQYLNFCEGIWSSLVDSFFCSENSTRYYQGLNHFFRRKWEFFYNGITKWVQYGYYSIVRQDSFVFKHKGIEKYHYTKIQSKKPNGFNVAITEFLGRICFLKRKYLSSFLFT